MINWFNKRNPVEYVELSIGKVGLFDITTGLLNRVKIASNVGNSTNIHYFLTLMEYSIVDLSKKKMDALSIADGKKVRAKVNEILNRYGIIEELTGVQNTDFSAQEEAWFNQTERQTMQKAIMIAGQKNGQGSRGKR